MQVQEKAQSAARERHLRACVVPILGQRDDLAGIHGSGSLFQRGDHHYLVTATHVARYLPEHGNDIGVPEAPGERNLGVRTLGSGRLASTPEDREDVAVFRFGEPSVVQRLKAGGWVFLTDADVGPTTRPGSGSLVFGWPEAQSSLADGVVTGRPVALQLARLSAPSGQLPTALLLEWPSETVPDLKGISGCPIWSIVPRAPEGVWDPSKEVRLLGVQHSVLKGSWIKGTVWQVVDKLIASLD